MPALIRGQRLQAAAAVCVLTSTALVLSIASQSHTASHKRDTLIREEFNTLNDWEGLKFRRIDRMTRFSIEKAPDGSTFLKAESDSAASAIVWVGDFDIYEFPRLRWRWKVANVFSKGDARVKRGDDYPIRIDIMFKYDPLDPAVHRIPNYSFAKLFYGRYPPYSSLNYIWANREQGSRYLASPYMDRTMLVPLQQGKENCGRWIEQDVDILNDYRKAFGGDPPRRAGLAIMSDSDDTGESSTAWVDWVEIYRIPEGD